MKKDSIIVWFMCMVLVITGLFSAPVLTSAQEPPDTWELSDFQSARLIIESTAPIMDEHAVEITNIYDDYYIIQYEDALTAQTAYKTFSEKNTILSIQPDCVVSLESEEIILTDASLEESIEDVQTQSDVQSWVQETEEMAWSSKLIGMDVFHEFILDNYTELPVVEVAVLDTGVDTDLDSLEGRILDGGKNYCSSSPGKPPEDDHGHGTLVSNIIVENTFANVMIMPIKVMNKEGEGYDSHIVRGFAYAMECGVDIINLSIGGDGEKAIYESIINKAQQMGIAVIVAAGNESQDVGNSTPANIDSSITISSINRDNTFSSFSNYGNQIDFCAPGDSITAIGIDGLKYSISGTSFATPYATAAFAMIKSVDYQKTGTQIYNLVKAYAVDLGADGWDSQFGFGRINLADIVGIYRESKAVQGDVNQDDMVNVIDAYMILQYIVGKQEFNQFQTGIADVDGDGDITVLDVLEILQKEVSGNAE